MVMHPSRNFRPVSLTLRIAVALAVVGLGACGSSKFPTTYAVKGKILVDGQPAKECQVAFNRTSGGDPAFPVTPNAVTDDKGEFQLTSYYANDGAPEGEYVVTIEWRERSGITKAEFKGTDRLGGDYAKADKNKALKGFVVQVARQRLDLPPYELTQSAQAKRKLEAAKKRGPGFGGALGGD
jgi:hypothetical protein